MTNRATSQPASRSRSAPAQPRAAPSVAPNKAKPKETAPRRADAVKHVPEERGRLIAEAAYFIAERRGFEPGNEIDDWLQAEAEFEARLKGVFQ